MKTKKEQYIYGEDIDANSLVYIDPETGKVKAVTKEKGLLGEIKKMVSAEYPCIHQWIAYRYSRDDFYIVLETVICANCQIKKTF